MPGPAHREDRTQSGASNFNNNNNNHMQFRASTVFFKLPTSVSELLQTLYPLLIIQQQLLLHCPSASLWGPRETADTQHRHRRLTHRRVAPRVIRTDKGTTYATPAPFSNSSHWGPRTLCPPFQPSQKTSAEKAGKQVLLQDFFNKWVGACIASFVVNTEGNCALKTYRAREVEALIFQFRSY